VPADVGVGARKVDRLSSVIPSHAVALVPSGIEHLEDFAHLPALAAVVLFDHDHIAYVTLGCRGFHRISLVAHQQSSRADRASESARARIEPQ
jgi:hypothetical protein